MSEKNWYKVKEIFTQAIDQPVESRDEFIKKMCGSDPQLLSEVNSLLEVFDETESESLIEENNLNVKSIVDSKDVIGEQKELINYKTNSVSSPQLKGDLDNIILKALRKEPDRRYQSVKDFSEDISNYLNGLPIKARPNTLLYRASKFYFRNKTASIIGFFLVLSLIGGIIATFRQYIAAKQATLRAEKRFQEVRKLSNSLLFKITPKIERLPGSTGVREEVVTQALEYLDSLAAESQDDLNLQSELASAYEKVSDVQGNPNKANLGDLQGGQQSLEKANRIRLVLVEKQPDDLDSRRLLAANFNLLGDFCWSSGNVEDSLQNYQKAIEIYENLVSRHPENLELNIDLYNTILNKTKVIYYENNFDESIKQYQDVIQKVEKLEPNRPQSIELQRIKAGSLIGVANALSWQNRYDILDDYVNKSLAIYEPLVAANPNDAKLRRDLFVAYFYAGAIYIEETDQRSRQYLEKSIKIAKETLENDKLNYLVKYDLAQSYSKLGERSSFEKKTEEAIDYLYQAQKILIGLVESEPKHNGYKFTLAGNYVRVAGAMEKKGDFQTALENVLKALDQHQLLYQRDPNDILNVRAIATDNQDIGRIYEKMKEPAKSLNYYQQSVEWFEFLKHKGGMGDYDKKTLETSEAEIEKLKRR